MSCIGDAADLCSGHGRCLPLPSDLSQHYCECDAGYSGWSGDLVWNRIDCSQDESVLDALHLANIAIAAIGALCMIYALVMSSGLLNGCCANSKCCNKSNANNSSPTAGAGATAPPPSVAGGGVGANGNLPSTVTTVSLMVVPIAGSSASPSPPPPPPPIAAVPQALVIGGAANSGGCCSRLRSSITSLFIFLGSWPNRYFVSSLVTCVGILAWHALRYSTNGAHGSVGRTISGTLIFVLAYGNALKIVLVDVIMNLAKVITASVAKRLSSVSQRAIEAVSRASPFVVALQLVTGIMLDVPILYFMIYDGDNGVGGSGGDDINPHPSAQRALAALTLASYGFCFGLIGLTLLRVIVGVVAILEKNESAMVPLRPGSARGAGGPPIPGTGAAAPANGGGKRLSVTTGGGGGGLGSPLDTVISSPMNAPTANPLISVSVNNTKDTALPASTAAASPAPVSAPVVTVSPPEPDPEPTATGALPASPVIDISAFEAAALAAEAAAAQPLNLNRRGSAIGSNPLNSDNTSAGAMPGSPIDTRAATVAPTAVVPPAAVLATPAVSSPVTAAPLALASPDVATSSPSLAQRRLRVSVPSLVVPASIIAMQSPSVNGNGANGSGGGSSSGPQLSPIAPPPQPAALGSADIAAASVTATVLAYSSTNNPTGLFSARSVAARRSSAVAFSSPAVSAERQRASALAAENYRLSIRRLIVGLKVFMIGLPVLLIVPQMGLIVAAGWPYLRARASYCLAVTTLPIPFGLIFVGCMFAGTGGGVGTRSGAGGTGGGGTGNNSREVSVSGMRPSVSMNRHRAAATAGLGSARGARGGGGRGSIVAAGDGPLVPNPMRASMSSGAAISGLASIGGRRSIVVAAPPPAPAVAAPVAPTAASPAPTLLISPAANSNTRSSQTSPAAGAGATTTGAATTSPNDNLTISLPTGFGASAAAAIASGLAAPAPGTASIRRPSSSSVRRGINVNRALSAGTQPSPPLSVRSLPTVPHSPPEAANLVFS